MSAWMFVVGALVVLVVGVFLSAAISSHPTPRPCLFDGNRVLASGTYFGESKCSGKPELVYYVWDGHPAHALNGVKICSAHVTDVMGLAQSLAKGSFE